VIFLPTTTCFWPNIWSKELTSGSIRPAAVGSKRDERNESARQRRHQSLRVGRLVGRSLYAASRLGLGDGEEHGDNPAWDTAEAEALYERLEQEVIPEFYTRNDKAYPPPGWRESGRA